MAQANIDELLAFTTNRMPLDLAKEMARSEGGEILLVSGAIPMAIGYPDEAHKEIIQLTNLSSPDGFNRKVALYRILNRRRLHEVVDYMENHGGYRCQLVRDDGTLDQGYYL